MPRYEYQCKKCEKVFEVVASLNGPSLSNCPTCNGPVNKVFSNVGVVFKGSGFYRTDSRPQKDSQNSTQP